MAKQFLIDPKKPFNVGDMNKAATTSANPGTGRPQKTINFKGGKVSSSPGNINNMLGGRGAQNRYSKDYINYSAQNGLGLKDQYTGQQLVRPSPQQNYQLDSRYGQPEFTPEQLFAHAKNAQAAILSAGGSNDDGISAFNQIFNKGQSQVLQPQARSLPLPSPTQIAQEDRQYNQRIRDRIVQNPYGDQPHFQAHDGLPGSIGLASLPDPLQYGNNSVLGEAATKQASPPDNELILDNQTSRYRNTTESGDIVSTLNGQLLKTQIGTKDGQPVYGNPKDRRFPNTFTNSLEGSTDAAPEVSSNEYSAPKHGAQTEQERLNKRANDQARINNQKHHQDKYLSEQQQNPVITNNGVQGADYYGLNGTNRDISAQTRGAIGNTRSDAQGQVMGALRSGNITASEAQKLFDRAGQGADYQQEGGYQYDPMQDYIAQLFNQANQGFDINAPIGVMANQLASRNTARKALPQFLGYAQNQKHDQAILNAQKDRADFDAQQAGLDRQNRLDVARQKDTGKLYTLGDYNDDGVKTGEYLVDQQGQRLGGEPESAYGFSPEQVQGIINKESPSVYNPFESRSDLDKARRTNQLNNIPQQAFSILINDVLKGDDAAIDEFTDHFKIKDRKIIENYVLQQISNMRQ